ncbi:adenylyl cyclase CyaB [Methanohalobium evestigatum Z-7303]|uniref:Adenylyl cyclase CyaB n=1 Tax=Methanohalobium evestigatum (strain ATCC BAA-1072 / DSM 3721 / NBRC 107634 / OCM 161 / Z-7303) TaxID=644295 RepID=D7EBU5_METEZ|nr:class IV adenylate cyclase [Methanohalobium evestigatum]ADI75067.1 adenylyl cyclase CyaB [Methanohalobium evestigatum Z-7303]
MIEVEVKARTDLETARKMLEDEGARFIETEHHFDSYYNAPHRDFASTDEALRIRSRDNKTFLTYKGKKMDSVSKTREEFETPVDSENMRNILLSLGFREYGIVEKEREVYKLDDFVIALDSVEQLGEFIEVELESEPGSDIEHNSSKIFEFLNKLGIEEKDSIRKSYLELVMEEKVK